MLTVVRGGAPHSAWQGVGGRSGKTLRGAEACPDSLRMSDVGLGDGGWGGEGSKGHFGQGNGTYRGAGARETRKSLDTGVKRDSQIQKGLS